MVTSNEMHDRLPRTLPIGFAAFLSAGSIYCVFVGLMYLWGYWTPFGVDVMPFLELRDIVRVAAFPLAASLASMVVGLATGFLLQAAVPRERLAKLVGDKPPGGEKFITWLLVGILIVSVLAGYLLIPERMWLLVGLSAWPPATIWAARSRHVESIFGHGPAGLIVAAFLLVLPVLALGHGQLNAVYLKEGLTYRYIAAGAIDGIDVEALAAGGELRLIGIAGGNMFVLLPDGETVLLASLARSTAITFRQHRRGWRAEASEAETDIGPAASTPSAQHEAATEIQSPEAPVGPAD